MDTLTKLAYQTLQQGKTVFSLLHKTLSNQAAEWFSPARELNLEPVSEELLLAARQRLQAVLDRDLQDAEAGVYPAEILFDNPWVEAALYYPAVWLDLPSIWQRVSQKQYQTFEPTIDTAGYPAYYLQNFHHQTNGYLSEMSANLYDLQVELLFSGAADAMRRRVLAPLKQGLDAFRSSTLPQDLRILDAATGTGRTLRFLRAMLPKAKLFGVDLSPTYLRKANALLSELPQELPQLCQANLEALPYRDHYFHGITCVFLFHELPGTVRQTVLENLFRVLKPGGTLVIADSIQQDTPEFTPFLKNFSAVFHEPYHRDYTVDDLEDRLDRAGFEAIATEQHFMSKYWIARKPLMFTSVEIIDMVESRSSRSSRSSTTQIVENMTENTATNISANISEIEA